MYTLYNVKSFHRVSVLGQDLISKEKVLFVFQNNIQNTSLPTLILFTLEVLS